MPTKYTTFDAFLSQFSNDQKKTLEKIRQTIRAAVPKAEEGISYGVAAFRLNGKPIAGLSAAANHCSYFPMSGKTVEVLKKELLKYDTSKGTIRFPIGKPLPAPLIRKLLKIRIAEIESPSGTKPAKTIRSQVNDAISALKRQSSKETLNGMSRYAIPSDKALGVAVGDIRDLGKKLGRNQEMAMALWKTDVYEARMLACFVGDPKSMSPHQMDEWCDDFDSWAICDTACFHLFDRSPHAWKKVAQWARRKDEFGKRAAFALLASLALHDKVSPDEKFFNHLATIDRAAPDNRNFVKKSVSWALRAIGRRTPKLHAPSVSLAQRLSESSEPAARWIGKDALRELNGLIVKRKMSAQARTSTKR